MSAFFEACDARIYTGLGPRFAQVFDCGRGWFPMVRAKRCSLVALTAGIAFGLLVLPAGAAQKPAARKSAAMKKQPAPAPAPAPVVPLSPEQMPANPPQVSYTNGQLSILAQNSTL